MLFQRRFHERICSGEIGCTVRATTSATPSSSPVFEARPGVLAAKLAQALGRPRDDFKRDVRKLKGLGLTFSLEVGYRLTPKGEALLSSL